MMINAFLNVELFAKRHIKLMYIYRYIHRSNVKIYIYIAKILYPSVSMYIVLSKPVLQMLQILDYKQNRKLHTAQTKKLMLYLWKQCCHFFHCLIDFVSTMSKAIYRKERWWSYIDVTIIVKIVLKMNYLYIYIISTKHLNYKYVWFKYWMAIQVKSHIMLAMMLSMNAYNHAHYSTWTQYTAHTEAQTDLSCFPSWPDLWSSWMFFVIFSVFLITSSWLGSSSSRWTGSELGQS